MTMNDGSAAMDRDLGERSVADEIASELHALGIRSVFGIPGVHNLALWSALGGVGIRRITTRHEQSAMHAADGYARVTGRLGVCLTTSGPGAANTVTASGEALTAGAPVLHITTTSPMHLQDLAGRRRGVVHELRNQADIFRPVSKSVLAPRTASGVVPAVIQAVADATTPPLGPVYLEVPTDILNSPGVGAAVASRASTDRNHLPAAAAAALHAATAAVLWVGNGAMDVDVAGLAQHLGAPTVATLMARSALDCRSPFAVNGPVHEPAVHGLVRNADLLIAIGTDFDGQVTQNFRMTLPETILRVDVDPAQLDLNASVAYPVVMTAAEFVSEVMQRVPAASAERRDDGARRAAETNALIEKRIANDDRDRMAWGLIQDLSAAVPSDVPVVTDMTMVGYWAAAYLRREQPRTLTYPMGWGTLGVGLATAIGASVGRGQPAVALLGDAGILYGIGELATIMQEGIPVVAVVFNDQGYGVLRYSDPHDSEGGLGELVPPDFVRLAQAFGMPARSVELADLPMAVAEAVRQRTPMLIETQNVAHPPVSIGARWPLAQSVSADEQDV